MPTPDASGAIPMSGSNGVVILANDQVAVTAVGNFAAGSVPAPPANVVDTVGFGTTPTTFEATNTNVALTATTSAQRNASGADNDTNNPDFTEAVPTPTNAAGETGPSGPLAVADITNKTGTVGQAISGFSATATGGTSPYTFTDPGTTLPPGVTIAANGAVSGTPTTQGAYNVVITGTDSAAPTAATDTEDFTFTINPAPAGVTPIADIQGTGATSPFDTQVVNTEGVVTARYPTGGLNGFYIQKPGADTANASDAIFVYGGPGGFTTYPAIGDSVDVTGTVSEFSGQTQITTNDGGVTPHGSSLGTVTPKTQVPGTDCALPGTACLTGAALDAAREVTEGEAFQPTAPWTATDVYDGSPFVAGQPFSSSMFGEIGVAADSTLALVTPTEVIDAQATAAKNARIAYNDAHRITIDDGSSTNYTAAANTGLPFPWYTPSHFPRVGSAVTFPAPVIFTFGFGAWRILPTTQVIGAPTGTQPQFSQTRAANAAPQDVGGDVKLATFNVLNFFPTTGNEYVTAGLGTCTYFTDREGNQITNNSCNPNGPRGAANNANLVRQRDKIVAAINTADADIVSLEELENSVHFNKPRDFAIDALVTALNAAAGPGTWAAVPSPAAAELPPLAEQDVIRNGFIYKPANVALVGGSVVLADESSGTEAFADAREPLAQAFKRVGTPNADAFAVIVNHFKSKGSGTPDPDGQGNANDRRMLQANSLVAFANTFKTLRGITRVFLAGDFNAYTEEDPMQILDAAGYTSLDSTSDPDEESYNFDGQIGSLDHVLANAAALADVEDVDIWPINGHESVYYEYSRFNYNVTNLYQANPFKSSDHNPELVGINTADPTTTDVQILGTNDFHGRLQNDTTAPTSGAAVLAGAVKQLRGNNPNTVFAAAGDLIGATTFESFIAKDKPTIDALNEAGLEVSSVGNHEFDQGYNDLVNRVMAPYDATTNPFGGANWEYLAANVRLNSDNSQPITPTWTQDFGSVKVGFIGAVTEHLPELVSPAGISQIHVTDIVNEANASADALELAGADVIVLLVHEGAPNTNCATMDDDPASDFGSIINGVNSNIDAIVSGHTHLAYDCSFPVAAWAGRPVTERPVVSAGQYGMALNKLVFTVDNTTGVVQAKTQALLPLKVGVTGSTFNYPSDPNTAAIVAAAVANAAVLGAQPLGQIGGPFFRGKLADGSTENRGAESTLGNLVAEAQRWNTRNPESGSAQIAFMNPGGLRADMVGTGAGAFPRTLTYKQAADVQPFANTLVNMDLTGAQLKTVLEQQWQAAGAARPFLKLGISKGFTYTSTPPPAGSPAGTRGTVTGMWLNGTPIGLATTYSVTVNSFLASGGDGFLELNNGAGKQDTGKTDLQGMVDYMAEFGTSPDQVDPDYEQNGVNVSFPPAAPASYAPGDHVIFDVQGWSMTNALDTKDTAVTVKLGATTLGTATLDNVAQAALPGFDVTGKATVDVVVPNGQAPGSMTLTLEGAQTGSESQVTVTIVAGTSAVAADDASVTYGQAAQIEVTVSGPGLTPTGTVHLMDGATEITSGTLDASGDVTLTVPANTYQVGQVTLTAEYDGDATHGASDDALTLTTTKATSTTTAADTTVQYGLAKSLTATVTGTPGGVMPTGVVTFKSGGTTLGSGTLSGGSATFTLPAGSLPVGANALTAEYAGDANYTASSKALTVTVTKATSKTKADVKPNNLTPKKKVKLIVDVDGSNGVEATGQVKIKVDGDTITKTLKNGKLKLNLGKFGKGKHKVKVTYLGSSTVEGSDDKVTFTVS